MIVFVVTVNFLVAMFNFYLAFRIWQLRKIIALITAIITNCEIYLSYVLSNAPTIIKKKQENIYQFRQRYQLLQLQLQKIRQIIILMNWMYRIWRRYSLSIYH
ncbi:MAG: hypothetical protein QNJ70_00260 [Xenococcaceae cyanobacterium MO_207.B15]|nr:hypothetical protein [Xenococcaceae cyanobacterium MO_207.B15]MDJ0745442.1 hypothetical protein [Xenococcaceae cyanobacterium MO_167.B27]